MMKKPFFNFVLFLALCSMSACTPKADETVSAFFSLTKYFDGEIIRLTSEGNGLHKVISKDHQKEEKEIAKPQWAEELHSFRECDFNRPAWIKSYSADTLTIDSQTTLTYKALESKLAVRKLEVILQGDAVYRISIFVSKRNSWYESDQLLRYEPSKGFSIIGTQKMVLSDPTEYEILAEIKP